MRKAEHFKNQVIEKDISFWNVHNCSLCQYECGFHFPNGDVSYDNGCYCTDGQNLRPSNWEDVAGQYNMQTHPNAIKKMDEFWGFKN